MIKIKDNILSLAIEFRQVLRRCNVCYYLFDYNMIYNIIYNVLKPLSILNPVLLGVGLPSAIDLIQNIRKENPPT